MKRLYSPGKICAVTAILLAISFTRMGLAETEIDNEFWISTSTNTANRGTLDNPFDGSTAAKFDSTLQSLPANSVIHILPGVYQTDGVNGWRIKTGDKILGSGMDNTILQLEAGAASGDLVLSDTGNGSNEEVRDLTCDCNYQGGLYTYGGVRLAGTGMAIRGVKVIHEAFFDSSVNTESWGITIAGYGVSNSVGNVIENCEVSQFIGHGGGVSAIAISGCQSGIIRDNRVFLTATNAGSEVAINPSSDNSLIVEGNYVDQADGGFYNDTRDLTNLIIANNIFKDVRQGILFDGNGQAPETLSAVRYNVNISDNVIMLTTNAPFGSGNGKWAISMDYATNVTITGNIVGWNGAPNPGELGYDHFLGFSEPGVQGLVVANNRVNGLLSNSLYTGAYDGVPFATNGYVAYKNYDFSGDLLTNLGQALPCTNTFYIQPPDAVIQMWGAGSVNVGQFVIPNLGVYGWNCSSNASATIFKPLPLPNDFWGGRRTFVSSWRLLTTNSGTYVFDIGTQGLLTNDVSAVGMQKTVSFVAPTGTSITTIAATNTISTAFMDYLQTYIWTAYQVQPGNYIILSGKVTAQ